MRFPVVATNEEFNRHLQDEVWAQAAAEICRRHRVAFNRLKRAPSSDHVVFLVDDTLVVKIYRPFRNCCERETKALEFVAGRTEFETPRIIATGEIEGFRYVLMTQATGVSMTRADWLTLPKNEQLEIVSRLAADLKTIHSLDAADFVCDWREFVEERAASFVERQIAHGVNSQIIENLPAFITANLGLVPLAPTVFLHGDVHFGNLRLRKSTGGWQISGLFDFADSRRGFHEYDFLAVGILMIQGQVEIQREFFRAYGYAETDLDEAFRRRLMMLTMLYETSDLRRYALRLAPKAVDFSLEKLEKAIWSFAGA